MQILEENFIEKFKDSGNHSTFSSNKVEILSISSEDETFFKLNVFDKFKHKKNEDITPQVILHSIQTLIDETQEFLKSKNINDVSPIVYLLNIHRITDIKEICKKISLEEHELISAFLENTFEANFGDNLKQVLGNLCMLGKVKLEDIEQMLEKEDKEQIKLLLGI